MSPGHARHCVLASCVCCCFLLPLQGYLTKQTNQIERKRTKRKREKRDTEEEERKRNREKENSEEKERKESTPEIITVKFESPSIYLVLFHFKSYY